ncbi:MAG: Na+/H+ antiporter NhaC family protein [Lachnospiraceae bacterium]|nr:Na+/H+ antiporter NhaC family protein [Lachnospiraceae bacterium]
MNDTQKNYGGKALLPIIAFLGLYLGCGTFFSIKGVESPFWLMPRYVALMVGILVAMICFRKDKKFSEKVDIYCKGAGASGVMLMGIIVLLAGGFASATEAIGGKESVVNLGIHLIPTQFLIPGIFLICCIISTCIGTSMGTQVTMIPVAIALAQGAGLSVGMAGAAAIAGAYFGDNLSMISDTTIIATKGVGAEMKDKFIMNFKIAIPAAVITMLFYAVLSIKGGTVTAGTEAGAYNILTILPYIAVITLAVIGLDVILALSIGTGLACIIGLAVGKIGFFDWAQAVGSGMEDMFWLAVFAMMVSGMMELVRYYGGIQWLVDTAMKYTKSRKSCQYVISLLSMAISGTTLNNPVACLISAPIAKELGGKYKIAPKRMASLLDIFSCAILMVVPHDSGCLLVQQYGGCSYLDIIKYAFYPVLLVLFTCITIQFGLLMTKEEKEAVALEKAAK